MMSLAEQLVPFLMWALIVTLVVTLFVPRGHGHRPFHDTHLDGDQDRRR
jgi:hypothetical protein